MKKIRIQNLHKLYNPNKPNAFHALKNISFDVEDGEMVILKGVSGSGKSTLLSLIGGLSKPTEGEILINEHNIAKLPDIMSSAFRHKEIGFIFQSFNLLEGLSVYQNVLAPLSLTHLSQEEVQEKVNHAMALANIEHKKEQKVSSLSGGEKQRCAIARAVVMEPEIILADEPTANLDKENALIFIEILKKFKALHKTVIIATHDVLFDELECIDRYVHIRDGEII
ncbi:ABC transporter ATP-binding protein [Sulfurospirillum oryzae]|uniref:ABC transporter ATP-binding protein n=1 Tax=Sulfurospirillum oryzae TaxID=2976535 RepID=UPI0021E7AA43|nr:ABC transporter ATP-binding protein [Sulfurospirillum oryzae]